MPEPEELTQAQLHELRAALHALSETLEQAVTATTAGAKPVDLDEPIGRLSRMEAMQQQQMAAANRRSQTLRLKLVVAALARIEAGDYGNCRECEEPVGYRRLRARPESRLCLACRSMQESR